jgi:hypothetical protein
MARQRNSRSLERPRIDATGLQTLESEITERQFQAARFRTAHTAFLHLAMFNFLRREHFSSLT